MTCLILPLSADPYTIGFATYLGGSDDQQVRDITVDSDGNVYLTGGTGAADFHTTVGPKHQGWFDVFVVKYDSSGNLIWSRLVGGPNYDRAYAIEVDKNGFVYVGGRAGPGYPTTLRVVQPQFGGGSSSSSTYNAYGLQDAFVTKLSPDGSEIIWSTFFGSDDDAIFRDIAIDDAGNIYGALTGCSKPNPHITPGAFCTEMPAPNYGVVVKLSANGEKVVWASYIGGKDGGYAFGTPSIRVDKNSYVVVVSHSGSADMPVTPDAYDRTKNGLSDMHIAKLSPDGSRLIFATYLGGSDIEYGDTHNLALSPDGNIVIAATTKSPDFPVTNGTFQTKYGGSGGGYNQQGDGFIAILSSDGNKLLSATFYGGSSGEGLEGVAVDSQGNIYVTGGTYSNDLPVEGNKSSANNIGDQRPDACAAKFAPSLNQLLFSTYLGGSDWDLGLATAVTQDGVFYLTGETKSQNFPTANAVDKDLSGPKDGILVQFNP